LANAKQLYDSGLTYTAADLFDIQDQFDPKDTKNNRIKASMFADDEKMMTDVRKIHYSMRVMPHDQNTGGFFVAVFKKHKLAYFPGKSPGDVTAEAQTSKQKENDGAYCGDGFVKDQKNNYVSFTKKFPDEWASIKKYYGLENFPEEQLFVNAGGEKIVTIVSKAVSDYLSFDTKKDLNNVNLG
jgi:hypothetical protein